LREKSTMDPRIE